MTGKISPSKNSRELKNNYKTLPLTIIDGIADKLGPSKSFRECKNITIIFIKNI